MPGRTDFTRAYYLCISNGIATKNGTKILYIIFYRLLASISLKGYIWTSPQFQNPKILNNEKFNFLLKLIKSFFISKIWYDFSIFFWFFSYHTAQSATKSHEHRLRCSVAEQLDLYLNFELHTNFFLIKLIYSVIFLRRSNYLDVFVWFPRIVLASIA